MIRELSGCDPRRAEEVLDWPIRDGLVRYLQILQDRAALAFHRANVEWLLAAPYLEKRDRKPPPEMPRVLRRPRGN